MDLSSTQVKLVSENRSLQRMRERMVVREDKSMETFRRYLDGIKNLQEYMKAPSPDELLSTLTKAKDITGILDDWVSNLQRNGKRANNIKSMVMGVKKFLFSNRVNGVEWDFIGKPKVSVQIRDRIPSNDELRIILSNKANLRDKALFMTAATSGLRIGTLATLKIGDLTPYENTGFLTITGGKGRKLAQGKEYHTWITPETYDAIQDYLQTRESNEPNDPLFAKINKGEESLSIYPQNIARVWLTLIRRAKLLKKIDNHRMYDLHVHTLRKLFQTKTKLAGCKTGFVDAWLGHAVSEYLNGSYFRPDIRESYTEYKKAIPSLTLFSEEQLELQTVKTKLEAENKELRKRVADLELILLPYREELNRLAERMEQLGKAENARSKEEREAIDQVANEEHKNYTQRQNQENK